MADIDKPSKSATPNKRNLKPVMGRSRKISAEPKNELGDLKNYNFDAEKLAVQHLIDATDPDPLDPMYTRYEVYLSNVNKLETIKLERQERESANNDVPVNEAKKAKSIGALYSREEDTMTLHTMEAMRLYLGLSPDPANEARFGVPGARRAATALRQLFLLSSMDNPYSDWMLIQADERVANIKQLIDKTSNKQLKQLDDMKAKGLNYGILEAKSPQTVSLGYHSPYGYMMSTMVVMFDHCVRVLKSAERRDLLTKREVHDSLFAIKHAIRSMFESTLKAQRVLTNENMRGIKRSDFLPQSVDAAAKKRIDVARDIFGPVPKEIFTGNKSPRHSLRNERLDKKEIKVLEAISDAQANQDTAAAISQTAQLESAGLID